MNLNLRQITNWLTIQGDDGARVMIGGTSYGRLPLDRMLLPVGEYNLVVRKPEYFSYENTISIQEDREETVSFSLNKKPKAPALALSSIAPGSGQLYQGYNGKGLLFIISTIGLGYFAYEHQMSFLTDHDDFKAKQDDYRNAESLADIEAAKLLMEQSYETMTDSERLRNVIFGVLGSVWMLNIVDVAF